jgi:RimJ/RimL family protein N-acetyltransferase
MIWKSNNVLETTRLRLRPWKESDAAALFKYASDPDIGARAGWPVHTSINDSVQVIKDYFSNNHSWAIELKETGEAIGYIGYYPFEESNIAIGEDDAEVGYWIGKPYWNQGLCTEALRAMVDLCFNKKGFITLWGDYFEDNPASGRVMSKCGFRDTGELRWLNHVSQGIDRPVKIMRLDYAL